MMGIVPYAGLSFCTYETLKAMALKANKEEFGTVTRLGAGGLAGLVAQTVRLPDLGHTQAWGRTWRTGRTCGCGCSVRAFVC